MCFDWIDFSLHTTVHTLQKPSTGNLHLICTKEMGVWGVINKLKSCKGLIVLIPHILNNFFKDKQNYLISLQIENKMKKWMNQWLNCWGRQPIISLHCSECRRFFFFLSQMRTTLRFRVHIWLIFSDFFFWLKPIIFSSTYFPVPYKCYNLLCESLLVATMWCWLTPSGKEKKAAIALTNKNPGASMSCYALSFGPVLELSPLNSWWI